MSGELLEDLGVLNSLDKTQEEDFGCYAGLALCVASSVVVAFQEEAVTEKEIFGKVANGVGEYLTSGDIANTWQDLGRIQHVQMIAKCLKDFYTCH